MDFFYVLSTAQDHLRINQSWTDEKVAYRMFPSIYAHLYDTQMNQNKISE